MQDRAGRDAGKDALGVDQLTHTTHGVAWTHAEARVDQALVVQLGHEALVEVAQAVDELAVARLGRDDADVGLVLAEEAPHAHQGARGAETCHEVRDLRQVGEDLRARAAVVRLGVGRVAVLVEHDPVGVLARDALGDADGLVRAPRSGRRDDLGAPHAQQLAALLGGVLRHDADHAVAPHLRDHRHRDARVAARGLQDRAARRQTPVGLGSLDHGQRRAVLDGSRGVLVLELGPQPHVRGRRQRRQTHQGCATDRRGQVREARHAGRGAGPWAARSAPPATAGRITTVELSDTSVARAPVKRMSSSST